MHYKGLIFDLDQTAIITKGTFSATLPTPRVIEAVKKAQEKMFVSVATGRNYNTAKEILHTFELKNPCVIAGGTKIINPMNGEELWSKKIRAETINAIIELTKPHANQFTRIFVGDTEFEYLSQSDVKVEHDDTIVYIDDLSPEAVSTLTQQLKKIGEFTIHPAVSVGHPELLLLHITAHGIDKKSAIEELCRRVQLSKEEIIAVGDNYNDIPLWEGAGLRVVMGNAPDELKTKYADYVAPHVEQDGLAVAIEKHILKTHSI